MEFNSIISIESDHFWNELDHLYAKRPLVEMGHITKELGLEFFDTTFSTAPKNSGVYLLRFKIINKYKYFTAKIKYGI